MRHSIRNSKKKFLAAGVAVAVGAGMYGVGANWENVTSIVDNVFSAEVGDGSTVEGALLKVTGSPLVASFNPTVSNQTQSSTWTITNTGDETAEFRANFALDTVVGTNQALADNVKVFYTVGGTEFAAGTLAAPKTLNGAIVDGGGTAITTIEDVTGSNILVVGVRVLLEDPTALSVAGTAPGDTLEISGDWNVEYHVATP